MRFYLIFHVITLSVSLAALNMYPIPALLYKNIQLNAAYKTTKMTSIKVSDGSISSIIPGIELGIGFGKPFNGFGLMLDMFNGQFIQKKADAVFNETRIEIRALKFRYHVLLLGDSFSSITAFTSFGPYAIDYHIHKYKESSGSDGYKQRNQNGYLSELGLLFSYSLNPSWQLFLSTAFQWSHQNKLTDPTGNDTSDTPISLRGASFTVGSNIQL